MSFRRLFDSVNSEVLDRELDTISGNIPAWIDGAYIKNGPGAFNTKQSECDHWFDGLALLNRIEFRSGAASYSCKYLRSKVYESAQEKGRITHSLFAYIPKMGPIRFLRELIYGRESGNNAAINILKASDRYFATTESVGLVEFDPKSLETMEVFKFEDDLHGKITTAHPYVNDDEYVNFDIVPGRINHYHYYKVNLQTMERREIGVIETQFLSYTHDFSVTDRYIIHVECPLVAFPASLPLRFGFFSYAKCYKWKPNLGTKFTVMDRVSGEVVSVVKTDAFLSLHHVNAFEDGGNIFVDLVAFDDDSVIEGLYIDKMVAQDVRHISSDARVVRYSINIEKNEVSSHKISDCYVELPTINRKKYGDRDYQYIYGVGINSENMNEFDNAIVKVSTKSSECLYWYESGSFPGEPFFIAKPEATEEDEGVLLTIVSNPDLGQSYVLIVDAKSMNEVSRIALPHLLPLGFHGNFYQNRLSINKG